MNERAECLAVYQRLLALLEEDENTIAHVMKGDLLESYRRVIREEKAQVLQARNELRNSISM